MAIAVPTTLSPRPSADSGAGHLFAEHSERIFGYCLRFLGSRSEAEDALQTTFLYAHRALERGVVPELEYPWLHSIAKNVCRWQLRTLDRRGSLTTNLDLDAMPSSNRNADVSQLRSELVDALATVPDAQRKALLLREWHGLESHEIATHLGLSTAATYALLTRARRSLAKALSAAGTRPVLGVDFVSALGKLKALLAGGTAKSVATAVAVGSVAIGGVAVERAVEDRSPSRQPATTAVEARSPSTPSVGASASGAASVANGRAGARIAGAAPTPSATTGPALPPVPVPGAPTGGGAAGPAGGEPGSTGSTDATSQPPVPVPEVEKIRTPSLELRLVDDVVEDVVDPLLDDPLAVVPPVDVELPLDEVAPPLSEVEEDAENVLETPLPDITPPLPKLPLP